MAVLAGAVLARSGGDGAGDSVELQLLSPARPELLRAEHELLPREHCAAHVDVDAGPEWPASGMRSRRTAASGGRDRGAPIEAALVAEPSASAVAT